MKLPHAEHAFVDLVKLRDYSLSATHPEGKHKARVFAAALGLDATDAEWLREKLLAAVLRGECTTGRVTEFGRRHTVKMSLHYHDREARILSAWIIRQGEEFPRLTTCYVI